MPDARFAYCHASSQNSLFIKLRKGEPTAQEKDVIVVTGSSASRFGLKRQEKHPSETVYKPSEDQEEEYLLLVEKLEEARLAKANGDRERDRSADVGRRGNVCVADSR